MYSLIVYTHDSWTQSLYERSESFLLKSSNQFDLIKLLALVESSSQNSSDP